MSSSKKNFQRLFFFFFPLLFFTSGIAQAQPDPIKIKRTSEQSVQTDVKTQEQFETWLDEENELLRQIHIEEAKLELLTWKNEKARQYTRDLQAKLLVLKEKKQQMEQISQELLSTLDNTVKQVREFIQTDIPYALTTRHKRVNLAEAILSDYDANLLLKTQTVLDLLSQEAALGHTTEIEHTSVEIAGARKEVRLLHIGRAALFALGTGEKETFFWNSSGFVRAPNSRTIRKALQMAEGKHIIGLVKLPLQQSRQVRSAM